MFTATSQRALLTGLALGPGALRTRASKTTGGVDEVPGHVAFMVEQAKTRTQRPKTMALVCVGRTKKIRLRWLPMGKGKGKGKGVSSATLKLL